MAPANIFLVTDAMATIGTDMTSFMLNGRTIHRKDGRLTLDDGTLAGADLDMISAVRFMRRTIGLDLDDALRMASLYPAEAIGQANRFGSFAKGAAADIVALSDDLDVRGRLDRRRAGFRGLRDKPVGPQLREQVEERPLGRLVVHEAEFAALGHVGHHLDRPAEVEVGMPGRGEAVEIGLLETVFRRPCRARSAARPPSAASSGWTFAVEADRLDAEPFWRGAATASSSGRCRH